MWIFEYSKIHKKLCNNILLKKKQFEIQFLTYDNYKCTDKNSIKQILYYSLKSKDV